jgi:hypothetical protein
VTVTGTARTRNVSTVQQHRNVVRKSYFPQLVVGKLKTEKLCNKMHIYIYIRYIYIYIYILCPIAITDEIMWYLFKFQRTLKLYVSFWVTSRRLHFINRRFGTFYLFHLHKQECELFTFLLMKMEQIECFETSAH